MSRLDHVAGTLCPVLVGRSIELRALRRALDRAGSGRGTVVFLLGEAGIGKSRLASELVGAARNDVLVLRGRALPGPRVEPFGPIAMALASVADELRRDDAALGQWMPALSSMIPGLGPRAAAPVDQTSAARGEAMVRALQSLGADRGVVLVLEDLHWADAETLAVVQHLTDNIDRAPALCVATVRSESPSPARELARAAPSRTSAEVYALERLGDADVRTMVRACCPDIDADLSDRVVAAAEGVPFLVEELLASEGLPLTFVEAIERRLEAMVPTSRAVLQTAAMFGRSFDWRLVGAAAGFDDDAVQLAMQDGIASQLLARDGAQLRFRHALTCDAVMASVLPPQRAALARVAFDALMAAPGGLDSSRRALAVELAVKAGDVPLAGALLLDSGRAARGAGALVTAANALGRARQLLPAGDARDAAADELLAVLVDVGQVNDALELAREVLASRSGEGAALLHLDGARAGVAGGRWGVAAEHLDRAAALAPADAPVIQARRWVLDAEVAFGTHQPEVAAQGARRALEIAEREGLADLACSAHLLLGRCERLASLDRARASFERALIVAEADSLPIWRMRALHELGTVDMLDRGRLDGLMEARQAAEVLGAYATIAVLDLELAAGTSMTFDLAETERYGSAAATLAGQLGLAEVEGAARVFVALVSAMRGDERATTAAIHAATAAAPDHTQTRALALLECEGILALVLGHRARAAAAMHAGSTMLRAARSAPPSSSRGLWCVLQAVDGHEAAPSALHELRASGAIVNRLNRGYADYTEAVLAGRADGDRAATLVAEGDANLAHGPFWLHVGRRLVAEAAIADGWGEPSRWLDEATAWFATHGCDALAASTRAAPRGGTIVPPAWARMGVSAREGDVLHLLIDGCTNKEIAAQLYVSPRTVEKHVESLLRKTATRSRTQLARVATQD